MAFQKRIRGSRGRVAWAGAALLVLVGMGAGTAAAEPATTPATTPAPAGGDGPRTVTLPTGDRVVVDQARHRYDFHPAAGREAMSYQRLSKPGHEYVIPGDARLLVASGTLDLGLFDVSALVAAGGQRGLVVTDERGARSTVAATAGRWVQLTEPAPAARGARLGSRQLRGGVRAVTPDGPAPAPPRRAAAAGDSELTLVYRDRDGAASADASTLLWGIDAPDVVEFIAPGPDGVATIRLPNGRYHLHSSVDTARPDRATPATSVLVDPEFTVAGNTRVQVIAATAQPVTVTVPDPAAVGVEVFLDYRRTLPSSWFWMVAASRDTTAIFTAHTGPTVPVSQLVSLVGAFHARPGPSGPFIDSPVAYGAAWHRFGRVFTGIHKRLAERDLSTVRAEHGSVAPGRHARKTMSALMPLGNGDLFAHGFSVGYTASPFTRTERHAGTVRWLNQATEYAATDDLDPRNHRDRTVQVQSPTAYRPGQRHVERWNLAPFWPDPQVRRAGDTISIVPNLYGDQASGREGRSDYQRAHLALYRDGELVGESDRLDAMRHTVPAGPARYTLTARAERDFTDLASSTSTTWTFPSRRTGADDAALPLVSVRYAPPVDLHSRGPGDRVVPVPVHVQRTAPGAALRSLTVEVSYDGGTTWQPVRVHGPGDHRVAVLRHPPGGTLVSLRATASDAAGGTVRQTIVNAYRLR